MPADRYFIAGTDTGVGKTLVTAALMAGFQADGLRCLPVKPVQTGWSDTTDDLAFCLRYSTQEPNAEDRADLNPCRLRLAASPHLAAARENFELSTAAILSAIDRVALRQDVLLIEGAGGLLVPLNETETMVDLIRMSHAQVILVARSGVGTLNHTALSWNELMRRKIPVRAVVLHDETPEAGDDGVIRTDNIKRIASLVHPVPVFHMPYLLSFDVDTLARAGQDITRTLRR